MSEHEMVAVFEALREIQAELDADTERVVEKSDIQRHLDALDEAGIDYLKVTP